MGYARFSSWELGDGIALFGWNLDVYFDDVRVRRLVDPPPAVALGAQELCP